MKAPKPLKGLPPEFVRLANIGVELAAAVVGLSLLGYWIDGHFKTGPWGLLTGAIVGIVGGLYNMVRKTIRKAFQSGRPKENQAGEKAQDDQPGDH